jgi:predicted dehydrogenase
MVARKEPLRAEQEAFINSIVNDMPVAVSGEDGLRALYLAKAIVQSGTERRIIDTTYGS